MGMIGVAMVFPEFVPIASDVQMLITLAHGIDHIYDEGADHQRIVGGPTNLEHFVKLQKLFQERFHKNSDLYASTLGFLAQVVTVEGAAHSGYYEKPRELKIYRELINALYARMVVSFGSSLVLPILKVDRIGEDAADFDPDKLAAAYSDYRNGIGIDILPGKTRNYALYLWTMIVQQQFDKFSAKHNRQKGVPGFTTNDTYYKEAAVRAGIKPSAILAASVGIGALISTKNVAINTLPRHAQERAIRRPGKLVRR